MFGISEYKSAKALRQSLAVALTIALTVCMVLAPHRAAEAATLVKDGKALGQMVLPQGHSSALMATAQDLQEHFRKMSGAVVPICAEAEAKGGPAVYLGCGTDLKVSQKEVWPDGYRLRVTGEAIYILAAREEGLRNGVYGLLEDHLGCRWFTIGEIGAIIPKRATIALPTLDEVQKPHSEYRNPWYNHNATEHFTNEEKRQNTLWYARNRRGGLQGYAGHYWEYIFPKKLQEQYPEIAPFYGGRRHPGEGQICVSNPRAVEIAAQFFIDKFNNEPELDFYSLTQNDGAGWCQCEACHAMGSNNAERVLIFANRVAEKVTAVHPDKGLTIMPYAGTIEPPKKNLKGHRNLYPVFCSFGMEQVRPLTHPKSLPYRQRVQRWMTMLSRGWCYDYIGWWPAPWTLFHNLEADQSYYRKLGFTGNLSEYLERNVGTDVFMWLSLKQMWDPEQKVDDLLNEFYPAYFGPAAGVMREIYESFEQHMLSVGGGGEVHEVAALYPMDLVEESLAKIAKAKASLDDKTILARLERNENFLRVTRSFLGFSAASSRFRQFNKVKDKQETIEAGQAYLDLVGGLVGTLSLGGAYHAYVERVLGDLTNPGTVFTKAGEFTYDDYYNDGGNVHQALRRSGYTLSPNGLSLKANTTGEVVYDFRAGQGLVFQEARLRYMHFYRYAGDHNKIEISRDGGKTWATAYSDVNWSGYSAEYDLTEYIAGANRFLLRFWHRSGPNELLAIDNLGVVGKIVPAGEATAKP